jgi:hypothetical protein
MRESRPSGERRKGPRLNSGAFFAVSRDRARGRAVADWKAAGMLLQLSIWSHIAFSRERFLLGLCASTFWWYSSTVTTQFVKPVETRIDNEFEVRRKAGGIPFQRGELLAAAKGADALFITPFDRLDADFFRRVSPFRVVIPHHLAEEIAVDAAEQEGFLNASKKVLS